jgi:hypothetical protein
MEFNPRAGRIDPAEPLTDDRANGFSRGRRHDRNAVMALWNCPDGIIMPEKNRVPGQFTNGVLGISRSSTGLSPCFI